MPGGAVGYARWLVDALGAAVADAAEVPGWQSRGHGRFADLRGIMVHHTGFDNATAASLATGRPDLAGPLANIHIARSGTVTVVAAGVAWHAGAGSLPWLPAGTGNIHTLGIECANTGTSPTAPHRRNWPPAQYLALTATCAALCGHLRTPASRVVGHKEYAGRAQGKWDPGAIDMAALRADVAAHPASPASTVPPDVLLLQRGSGGPQVAELQRRLRAGYAAYAGGLDVDGEFGPQTEAAVREFQRRTTRLVIDGIVGPATAQALRLRRVADV